jgi:DMSO/TMAO reductase YedYZ molybdopterin-dependent catalytic subunit
VKRSYLIGGAILGGITSLPMIALLALAEALAGLEFFPFRLFEGLARILPGSLIETSIGAMVWLIRTLHLGETSSAAKLMEQGQAIALFIVFGVIFGALVGVSVQKNDQSSRQAGLLAGLAAGLMAAMIEWGLGGTANLLLNGIWLVAAFAAWGSVLGWALRPEYAEVTPEAAVSRRRALRQIAGGSLVLALGAWGLARLLSSPAGKAGGEAKAIVPPPSPTPGLQMTPEAAAGSEAASAKPLATAVSRELIKAVPGVRPELTPAEDFYRIDINLSPIEIDNAAWQLEVKGLFNNPHPLRLDDIKKFPPVRQPATMSCISNPIGGDLIGTGYWTGARLLDVLKDQGLKPEAQELYITSADGFYESVSKEDCYDPRTLLVYALDDQPLSALHGFPLRIYIPNRYGMKQPKWIVSLEALPNKGPGYWVDRGWSPEARPQTLSVIDAVAKEAAEGDSVPVGGIAWAGDREISKVEVQVDGGEWQAAELRTPPLGPLTWVQWRFDWRRLPGLHSFMVRAVDGRGKLQTEVKADTYPDGATGYHELKAQI